MLHNYNVTLLTIRLCHLCYDVIYNIIYVNVCVMSNYSVLFLLYVTLVNIVHVEMNITVVFKETDYVTQFNLGLYKFDKTLPGSVVGWLVSCNCGISLSSSFVLTTLQVK